MTLYLNLDFYGEVSSFIEDNILTVSNLSGIRDTGVDRDENLYQYFSKIAREGNYYQLFKHQHIHSKKRKSKLYIDAKYLCCDLLRYPETEFSDLVKNPVGDGKENIMTNCLTVLLVGTINAMRHDGVLKKLVNEYHNKTFEIALNKLRRNKILNNGLLLKLSMRDCGMF